MLQGTDYFPDLQDTIVFVEDDYMVDGRTFDRDLQSLLHQPGFGGVRGLVISRRARMVAPSGACRLIFEVH